MTAEVWGFVGVLVTALSGGSVITGLLSGSFETTRRGRLRRSLERTVAVRAKAKEAGQPLAAIDYAIALDLTRLAALSAVGMPDRLRRILPISALFGVFYVGLLVTLFFSRFDFAIGPPTESPWVLVLSAVVFAVAGSALVFLTGPHSVAERRRQWVQDVMDGSAPDAATSDLLP